jgi:hypothetical protein
VADRAQPLAEPPDALVVVAGDVQPPAVERHLVAAVEVVRLPHVLDEVAAEHDVDRVQSPADGEQRQVPGEDDARHAEVESVLADVDVVQRRVWRLPGPVRGQVAAAGEQDTVRPVQARRDRLVGVAL